MPDTVIGLLMFGGAMAGCGGLVAFVLLRRVRGHWG